MAQRVIAGVELVVLFWALSYTIYLEQIKTDGYPIQEPTRCMPAGRAKLTRDTRV